MNAVTPHPAAQVAVLCCEAAIAERVCDRLRASRRIAAAGFDLVTGRWGDADIVCAWPTRAGVDWAALVNSVAAAHRPGCVVATGPVAAGAQGSSATSPLVISRVCDPRGEWLGLSPIARAPIARAAGVSVAHPAHAKPGDAVAAWPGEVAGACCERSLPLVLVGRIPADAQGDTREWRHLASQRSVAGRLGAALGGVWRRPKFAGEALSRLGELMSERDELVDRLEQLTAAVTRADGPLTIAAPWRE